MFLGIRVFGEDGNLVVEEGRTSIVVRVEFDIAVYRFLS